jgi:hypothetical protein
MEIVFRTLFSSDKLALKIIKDKINQLNANYITHELPIEIINLLKKSSPVAANNSFILLKCDNAKEAMLLNN